jgi:predicted outer membrane protein
MKLLAALTLFLAIATAGAAEAPAKPKKIPSTVPGPYPSIIQITPVEAAPPGTPPKIIQSELSGRDLQFFQNTSQAGQDQLALAELAKSKGSSDQVIVVAETIASTQATESKEVARLAAAKQVTLSTVAATTFSEELRDLAGAKFEKAWIERLIAVNETALAGYETGAQSSDADVRLFAEKMLPVAKARLQMANRLGGRSAPPAATASPGAKSAATPARPTTEDQGAARTNPPPIATPAPAKR